MAKQNKGKKGDRVVGKGKVTPLQIAFIVDRYLADNNYTNTLAAFRAEADDLFSKTKGKEAPKGLLGLADILDEYISLKEQRMMVDQEKRRVESALHGIQEVMRAYASSTAGPISLQPTSPPLVPPQMVAATPTASFLPLSYPNNGSPPVHGTTLMNYTQPPMLPPKAAEPIKLSTPIPECPEANKRKASKSAPKVPPAPKKSRTHPPTNSSMIQGNMPTSEVTCISNTEKNIANTSAVQPASINNRLIMAPVHGSSTAKSLFKQLSETRTSSSSPKTPPQGFPSQADKLISPEDSILHTNAATSREVASANCSIISSETIIVSPLKQTGYYAIERSYHVTSPFKSSPRKVGKREHVKGRLHFGEPEAVTVLEKPLVTSSSTSSTDEESPGTFDYDLPDFDIFDGDFLFTELLEDIDLECEGITTMCQPAVPADFISRSEHNSDYGCSETNQVLPGSCLSTVTKVLSEDMGIQGPDSVTSVTTITKCIKILSPAKTRSNCSMEQTNSPAN